MFPEITRDEVFRLETRRLWLRWPEASDADAVSLLLAQKHAGPDTGVSLMSERAVQRWIESCRADNKSGQALRLVLTLKADEDRPVVGAVRIGAEPGGEPEIDFCLGCCWRGQGLMHEAILAITDAAFLLGSLAHIRATPRVLDLDGRRVLERCGFTFMGSSLARAGQSFGLSACDVFCLDRRTWRSLKSWTMPDFGAVTFGTSRDGTINRGPTRE